MTNRDWAFAQVRDIVKRHDKDRYLASLFAAEKARPQLWALLAFNYEIARIRELVSEPELGEIRLQWWLETVEGIYRGVSVDHPVALALAVAIENGRLPKSAFLNLIEARRFDLYADPISTLADLEGYLGETSSVLIQLGSLILAGPEAEAAAEASGLAGVAYGMTGLIRALPLHRARGQCYLPHEMLLRRGLTPADLIEGQMEAESLLAVGDVAELALERLARARRYRALIPEAALPAFYPAGLVELYLAALRRQGREVLRAPAEVSQLARQWRLWRMARARAF